MLPEIVKALIFTKDHNVLKLLILTRATLSSSPGIDDLPGGKVNPSEALTSAIVREINEETQLQVSQKNVYTTQEWLWPNGVNTLAHLFIYYTPYSSITIDPQEHSHSRWVSLDDINQSSLPSGIIKIILTHEQQIKDYLKKDHEYAKT